MSGPGRARLRTQARRMAVQALYQWQIGDDAIAAIEAQFLADHSGHGADLEYFHELLEGVARERGALDEAIAPCLDRPADQVDAVERAILWMAGYELKTRWDVPYRVVINEAVELAHTFGGENAHRFVNAVLDRLAARERAMEVGQPRRDAR